MASPRVLVLGGARSGKSTFAERRAAATSARVVYVATATADDDEMAQRIAMHRARRPESWRTLEAPTGVAAAVAAELDPRGTRDARLPPPSGVSCHRPGGGSANVGRPPVETPTTGTIVIVEDLTFLLSNLLAEDEERAEARAHQELAALLALPVELILISNEVGMGLVPPYPLGRLFRDALGRLNQSAATACDQVYILFAGLPLQLK